MGVLQVLLGSTWAIISTVAVLFLSETFKPYALLVDIFTTYVYIYNNEVKYIENTNKPGEKWSFWDYFSLLRNYVSVSLLRGILIAVITAYLNNELDTFDLMVAIRGLNVYLGECLGSLTIIVGFHGLISLQIVSNSMLICAITARFVALMDLHKKFNKDGLAIPNPEHLLRSYINGAFGLITVTVVEIIFRGNLKVIESWFTLRSFFLLVPFLQLNFARFGLDKYHGLLIQQAKPLIQQTGIAPPTHLFNGVALLTAGVLSFGYFTGAGVVSGIIHSFF